MADARERYKLREQRYKLRAQFASHFGVPDAGRYANDWTDRIDAVLSELAALRKVKEGAAEQEAALDEMDAAKSFAAEEVARFKWNKARIKTCAALREARASRRSDDG